MLEGCSPDVRMMLQEIAKQAVLWVMAGARALGEVLVAVYILRGRVCVKKLTHAVELACNRIVCSTCVQEKKKGR